MEQEKKLYEHLPFNKEANEMGFILRSQKIENEKEIKTPYGPLIRIGKISEQSHIPYEYQRKKYVFSGKISDKPVIIVHFSDKVYGEDKEYFKNIYENYKQVLDKKITQFTKRKITPSLLGFSDKNLTLIIEKAPHDLEFYFFSKNRKEIKRALENFIEMNKNVWEESKKINNQYPRYISAFLKHEYSFLEKEKIEDYLKDEKVIYSYKQTRIELKNFLNGLNQIKFERGFGFGDSKPSNLVEDDKGNILFIDVGKPSFSYHWLSMIGQFYQDTIEKAPNSLFSKILKQEIRQVLKTNYQQELAVSLFALGRMNKLLLPHTLRNIVFTSKSGCLIDENQIKGPLDKVKHLIKIKSAEEIINYESDEFDSNWRERLKDYRLNPEFQKNFQLLKKDIDKSLPKKKPKTKLLFAFRGIPGSGKSTISQIINNIHSSVILQSDWIFFEKLREQIGDDYYKAYAYQEELAKNYLKNGYSVIMDDNNQTIKNRTEVYKLAILNKAKPILINIDVNLEKAANRVTLKGKEIKTREEIIEGLRFFQTRTEKISKKEKIKIINLNGNETIPEIFEQLKREF